jgi:hypothetical protein
VLILCYENEAGVKKVLILVFVGSVTWQAESQALRDYWMTGATTDAGLADFEQRVARHIQSLRSISHKNDVNFLFQVYRKTGKVFLAHYKPLVEFSQLSDGVYDCLTATALYTVILNELKVRYSVFETNYHIFLTVHLSGGDILIETTDRLTGFVTDPVEIDRIKSKYVQQAPSSRANMMSFEYSGQLDQTVSGEELNGLLLFNQAVKAYNDRSWKASDEKLRQSERFYQSARTRELRALIQLTQSVIS